MLHHALRIHDGQGIYVPPSIDFIPYLYTPLYPALLAMLGERVRDHVHARPRDLGRRRSLGIARTSRLRPRRAPPRAPAARGPRVGGRRARARPVRRGLPVSSRAGSISSAPTRCSCSWSRPASPGCRAGRSTGEGLQGHGRVAAGAAMLALAFFCKQTGIIYVALGGVIVLVAGVATRCRRTSRSAGRDRPRRHRGCSNPTTHGWFWTYVSEIHRAHDFNMDRFWKSFGNILWHFPAMTIVIVDRARSRCWSTAARGNGVRAARRPIRSCCGRRRSRCRRSSARSAGAPSSPTSTRTCRRSCTARSPPARPCRRSLRARDPVVGRSPRSRAGRARRRRSPPRSRSRSPAGRARWQPRRFMPTPSRCRGGRPADRADPRDRRRRLDAVAPLVPRARRQDAARPPHGHQGRHHAAAARRRGARRGAHEPRVRRDRPRRPRPAARAAAIRRSLPTRPEAAEGRASARSTPARRSIPDSIWVPGDPGHARRRRHASCSTSRRPTWDGWARSGVAWGNGPVAEPRPGQDLVLGATGARFATSMTTGDAAIGRMTSPMFMLDGVKLTLRLGGGTDSDEAARRAVGRWRDRADRERGRARWGHAARR